MCPPLKENSFFGMLVVALAYITKFKKERKKGTDSETLSQTQQWPNAPNGKFKVQIRNNLKKKKEIFHEILP
jgi:hypothetical protein